MIGLCTELRLQLATRLCATMEIMAHAAIVEETVLSPGAISPIRGSVNAAMPEALVIATAPDEVDDREGWPLFRRRSFPLAYRIELVRRLAFV